ncbi:MAG: hypothetical protein LBU34_05870 [Planctomycetaceae bacterium]|nr:hypothetical protein [Planctomycetaceae bacterium]
MCATYGSESLKVGNRSPNGCVGVSRPVYFLLSASRQRNRYGEGLSPNGCLPFVGKNRR